MALAPYGNPEKPYGFELVADAIIAQGVDTVFCLSGNSIISLLATLGQKGVKVVSCRSEQGAVLAATGYAINTGKVGVALVTAGYMSIAHYAMLNATWGHVPVVVIAGANETYTDELRAQQELDQKPIAKSAHVKAAYHVIRGERIPQMVGWSFNIAKSGVPGVAFIDVCQDIMKSQVDAAEVAKFEVCNMNSQCFADPEQVKKAVELLASAKNPVISIGRLGAAADIREELKELVDITGIPVDSCFGNLGDHPLNIGMAAGDADVVLLVGKESIGIKPQSTSIPYNGKIIAVYPDTTNFGHSYPIEMGLAGDIKPVMRQIIEAAKGMKFGDYSAWVAQLIAARDGFKAMMEGAIQKHLNDEVMHPAVVAKAAQEVMEEHGVWKDAVVAMDGGDCMNWFYTYSMASGAVPNYPGQVVSIATIENGTAIGLGLPMAAGAAIGSGRMLFMPALGDGSMGYHLGELETMARNNVPAVIVVCNNSCWGMVYNDQRRIYGRGERSGGFLGDGVHYEKVCEGLGGVNGGYITKPADVKPAIEKAYQTAIAENKPVIVNCITNPFVYSFPFYNWTLPATENGEPYQGYGD